MIELLYLVVGLILLLFLDLLVAGARAAFLNTNLIRMLSPRVQLEPQVSPTLTLLHTAPKLQASLSLLLTVLRFLLVALLIVVVNRQLVGVSLPALIGSVLLAALLLFGLEWVVESWALRSSIEWALRLTPFARVVSILLGPLVSLPLWLSGDRNRANEGLITVTEDELKTMVDAGQEEGLLELGERKMIYSVFELGETLAREIMVPRIDIIALEVNTPIPQAADAFLESGNSRLPIYEETIDNILGLLYAKDLLQVWRKGIELESLQPLLRPVHFVPEAKKADELLAEMQSQRIHMSIVVDEYGGVAGLVTLEDIVEEILGEIQDEYDQGEEMPFQELDTGDYIFLGRIDLDDFNEILSSSLPKDEADTLGGFIYSRMGRVPLSGESIQVDNLLLTVEQVTGRRIRKVRAERVPSASQKEQEGSQHVDG